MLPFSAMILPKNPVHNIWLKPFSSLKRQDDTILFVALFHLSNIYLYQFLTFTSTAMLNYPY